MHLTITMLTFLSVDPTDHFIAVDAPALTTVVTEVTWIDKLSVAVLVILLATIADRRAPLLIMNGCTVTGHTTDGLRVAR